MVTEKKFIRTAADDCVFVTAPSTPGYAACGTHVDDIGATGDALGIKTLIATLKSKFELTTIFNPNIITGVQIERNRELRWTKLHQEAVRADERASERARPRTSERESEPASE